MNIGIIGYGNIGELLLNNLINLKNKDFNNIYVSNRHVEKINHLKNISKDILITDSNIDLAKNCEKIIICVESPDLKGVLTEIKPHISKNTQIIHTCAGVDYSNLNKIFDSKLTCVIPTISSTYTKNNLKKGISLILYDNNVKSDEKEFVNNLFSRFSITKVVKSTEELANLLIVTSCMPAFISLITKRFSEKISNKTNINSKEIAYLLFETLNSTSEILKKEIYTNDELIEKVATKGGITQRGLNYLNDNLNEIENELINHLI